MKKLKSENHHWWPKGVSKNWAASDGTTGWLSPDGSCERVVPAKLGAIGNGHHIKLGKNGEPTPWDQSFEGAFDKADNDFPKLIEWLGGLERRPVWNVSELRSRFIPLPCTDDQLLRMTECAVSLAVRSPMNRAESIATAEYLRGNIPSDERKSLIALNMRNSQRIVADSIGSRGKFVAIYSQKREFIFGDGFFHSIGSGKMAPMLPKMVAPITPHISILICRPQRYMTEPRLFSLVLEDHEVDILNDAVQAYSKDAIYFRSQQPVIHKNFRRSTHFRYAQPDNAMDSLIHSIPGVAERNKTLDHLHDL